MTTTGSRARQAATTISVIALAGILSTTPAAAQETRAELIAARQAEKAKTAAPYKPSAFERIMAKLEENIASPPNGFYPEIGRIPQGGGFSAGVGYRHFFGPQAVFDLRGAYSIKNYQHYEAAVRTPWNGSGRLVMEARAGYLDAPQVGYFGIGMVGAGRTNFTLKQRYGLGRVEFQPTSWTRLNGEAGYDAYETGGGKGRHPSIETTYTASDAPGLFTDLSLTRLQGQAAIDWRTSPGYSRKGGFYGVTLENYSDSDDVFTFQKLNAEAIQHIPILRENWVLSFRGRMESIVDDTDTVPFFLLPQLGSGRTLRGYQTGRFRDRHSLLTSAEIRWVPNRLAMDMAVFYDAGKVTRRREDLDLDDLKTDWGVGIRFHGPTMTVLRVEAARGDQGWRLVVSRSGAW